MANQGTAASAITNSRGPLQLVPKPQQLAPKATRVSAIPNVPLLDWQPRAQGNLTQFTKAFGDYASGACGDVAWFIVDGTDQYPDYSAPTKPDPVETSKSGKPIYDQLESSLWLQRYKAFEERVQDAEQRKLKLFALIMQQLSSSQDAKLRLDRDSAEVLASRDPIKLWKLLRKTHRPGDGADPASQREEIRRRSVTLRQRAGEDLTDYQLRWDDSHARMIEFGMEAEVSNDEDMVLRLIQSLDATRFGQWMDDQLSGRLPRPATVAEAFQAASEAKVITHTARGGIQIVNAVDCVVLKTSTERHPNALSGGSGGGGGGKRKREGKEVPSVSSSGGEKKYGKKQRPQGADSSKQSDSRPKPICPLCKLMEIPKEKKRHFIQECPAAGMVAERLEGKTMHAFAVTTEKVPRHTNAPPTRPNRTTNSTNTARANNTTTAATRATASAARPAVSILKVSSNTQRTRPPRKSCLKPATRPGFTTPTKAKQVHWPRVSTATTTRC